MNVSRLAELIPTSALKFSKKILVHFTSRDTSNSIAPRVSACRFLAKSAVHASGLIRANNLRRPILGTP